MKIYIIAASVFIPAFIVLLSFSFPAYNRYQSLMDAKNNVEVSSIEIRNVEQHIEIEKQKAAIRVEEAKGISKSQEIIAMSLTSNYLQYLAIKAQEKMATGSNHTEVYIPSGFNGIPLVKAVGQDQSKSEEK